ncbi:MAG: P-type ATPase, partial [Pseudobdellovibrionaceae bacterium]
MATFREVWKHVTSQLAKAKSSRDRGDQKINQLLLRVADVENDMALKALHSFPQGLTAEKVEERLKEFGRNVVAHEKAIPAAVMLLSNFKNPFILVLLVLGVVSYLTDDIKGALVVSVMVIVSVIMRFVQEYRSSKAADALKAMVKTTATVTRQTKFDGIGLVSHKMDIPFDEVVTGDIIHISAGDMVPADIRLLSSKDLFISESALTGESMPIEKYDTLGNIKEKSVSVASESSQNILEKSNLCFLGTNVVSGSATGVVVATGESTLF